MRQYLSDSIYVTIDNIHVTIDNNYVTMDNSYATMLMRRLAMAILRKTVLHNS